MDGPTDSSSQGDPMEECEADPHLLDNPVKDFNELADIYWVFSLISIVIILNCVVGFIVSFTYYFR